MSRERRLRDEMRALCGEIREDDGVDPREFFKPERSRKNEQRKSGGLCKQVRETVSLVLSGECDDNVLQSLSVVSVDPAPDLSRLCVNVRGDDAEMNPTVILQHLESYKGQLRYAVAMAISRKRVPQLTFRVIAATADEGGDA